MKMILDDDDDENGWWWWEWMMMMAMDDDDDNGWWWWKWMMMMMTMDDDDDDNRWWWWWQWMVMMMIMDDGPALWVMRKVWAQVSPHARFIQEIDGFHFHTYILKAKSLRILLFSHIKSLGKVRKSQHKFFETKVRKLVKSLKMQHSKAKCQKIWNQEYVNQRFWAFVHDFSTLLDLDFQDSRF